MKKFLKYIFIISLSLSVLSCSSRQKGVQITEKNGEYQLLVDGNPVYVKGIGGMSKLDLARENGANAFRTWGGDPESLLRILESAKANEMYVMQGIGLSKDSMSYRDEAYKSRLRSLVKQLAVTAKDDPQLIIWGIGNEIALGGANNKEVWGFVEELAQIIKSIDTRHLVSTVISHNPPALDSLAKYAPSLDLVGINSYGSIDEVSEMVEKSAYEGCYLITEWGPRGFWESPLTEWEAPVEQTSEEKRIVYEERYNKYIKADKRCLGSFVFLWGQKEERTPTWFCMFVEEGMEGLPLNGEKTPMVEAMERVWTEKEPVHHAPVVTGLTLKGQSFGESITAAPGEELPAEVLVSDPDGDPLSYVWEILREASELGFGGSFEPRPERIGQVETTTDNTFRFRITEPGNYRVYAYVLDQTGFVATVNAPFQIR